MVKRQFIPLASPDINDDDIAEVARVLKSGMLVQGVEVEKLENEIASFIGVKHCVAASNGTATLHLCLVAMGIAAGDEVIVPAFSYIASANVIELVGATPVFVDIDIDTFNVTAAAVEKAITPRTKAIIIVHEFGLAADITRIMALAHKHNIPVIEDAACALGATEYGKRVGSFGLAGSFSLHPRKAISSGEGGLITTNDDAFAQKLRILRNHGISMEAGRMNFVAAGFNYRMTDFQAALVRSQFQRLTDILREKQYLAGVYFEEISSSAVKLPVVPQDTEHTWQTFHVVLDERHEQSEMIAKLREKGIGTNYGAQCIPYQTYFAQKYKLDCDKLYPNSLRAYQKGLALPVYEKLTADDIKYIAQSVNELTSH